MSTDCDRTHGQTDEKSLARWSRTDCNAGQHGQGLQRRTHGRTDEECLARWSRTDCDAGQHGHGLQRKMSTDCDRTHCQTDEDCLARWSRTDCNASRLKGAIMAYQVYGIASRE
eukprot:g50310.t1